MESSQAKEFKKLKNMLKDLTGIPMMQRMGKLEGYENEVNELLEDTMYQVLVDLKEGLSEIMARGEEE